MAKRRVLIFTDWFVPGFKAGGPVKSISNMVNQLAGELEFLIVTSDRDFGSNSPYTEISINNWNNLDKCKVLYLSPDNQSYSSIKNILKNESFDVLYINGIFSKSFSIYPVVASKHTRKLKDFKTIIAPRGMLGKGALKIKSVKKRLFLKFMNQIVTYKKIYWHATSQNESQEIAINIKDPKHIYQVENFIGTFPTRVRKNENSECYKLVFLSRIASKKNLDFALKILKAYKGSKRIEFDIYGPIEEDSYWNKCLKIINKVPNTVKVNYMGELSPLIISQTLIDYDVLFFPTKHENFGHVVIEALQSGLFILISDQTPWNDLNEYQIGKSIPLQQKELFIEVINNLNDYLKDHHYDQCLEYINQKIDVPSITKSYLSMF